MFLSLTPGAGEVGAWGFGITPNRAKETVPLDTKGSLPSEGRTTREPGSRPATSRRSGMSLFPNALDSAWNQPVPRSVTLPGLEGRHGPTGVVGLDSVGVARCFLSGKTLEGYAVIPGLLVR